MIGSDHIIHQELHLGHCRREMCLCLGVEAVVLPEALWAVSGIQVNHE